MPEQISLTEEKLAVWRKRALSDLSNLSKGEHNEADNA